MYLVLLVQCTILMNTSNVSWFHNSINDNEPRTDSSRIVASSVTVRKHRMHSRSPVLKKIPKPANAEYPQQEAAGEEESLQRETRYVYE